MKKQVSKSNLPNEELQAKIKELKSKLVKEEYLQKAFDEANDFILIIQDDLIKYSNRRAMETLFTKQKQTHKTSFIDHISHPQKEQCQEYLQKIMNGEKISEQLETSIIQKNNDTRKVKISAHLIQYNNDDATLLIIHDITDLTNSLHLLKESEAKYRRFFRASKDCVFFTTKEGKWIDMSDGTPEFFGYENRDEFLKIPIPDLYENPENRDRDLNDIESDGFTRDVPINLKKKDGSIMNTLITSQSLRNEYGEIYAYQGIIRDVTELKKKEHILRENEKNLKVLNDTKNQFFSIISHDLRSPFNAIIAYADLLRNSVEQFNPLEVADIANDLYKTGKETYRLLNNLLEWASTQTGKLSYEPEVIQVKEVLDKTLSLLKENALKKGIAVTIQIPDNLRAYVDERMFTSIVRNIFDNAIKFTDLKGEITIEALEKEEMSHIIISDTGMGMSPEKVNDLFVLNKDVRSKGTRGETGTGLGLLLCKEFAQMNQGIIHVESQPGIGSEFTLIFPKKPPSGFQ